MIQQAPLVENIPDATERAAAAGLTTGLMNTGGDCPLDAVMLSGALGRLSSRPGEGLDKWPA